MIVLNFSHPLTDEHISTIENLTHQPVDQVISIPVQFDTTLPFGKQLDQLLSSIPLNADALQIAPLLVNLPSLNSIAGMVLAGLHGIMGHFPSILRLRPVTGSTPTQFEVAEVINLQELRDKSRLYRKDNG